MTHASRRTFLAATGTGAAAAAALAAAPGAHASPATTDPTPGGEPHLVAYVQDASSNQLTLLVGEDEVVVHDAALVRSLTRAARR